MVGHPLLAVALVAMVARVGAVLISTSLPPGTFVLDDSTYTGMAAAKANGNAAAWDPHTIGLWDRTSTFTIPMQWLFTLFGPHMWIAQLYVTLWGIATCVLTVAIALRVLPTMYALAAGLFVAVLPSQVLWSSLALKDAAVWATLAALGLLVLHSARAQGRQLALFGLATAVVLFLIAHLREHTLVVAGWALVVAALFGRNDTRPARLAGALLLAIVMPWLHGWGPGGESLIRDPNLATRRIANAQGAGSAFIDPATGDVIAEGEGGGPGESDEGTGEGEGNGENGDPTGGDEGSDDGEVGGEPGEDEGPDEGDGDSDEDEGPVDEPGGEAPTDEAAPAPEDSVTANLRHLPRGITVMLFEPVPWRAATSANMSLARWETIVWYPLLALALIGLIGARRRLASLAFGLLAGGGMLLVYALAEGNIGTAYRHRGEFVWVVALLAALGLQYIMTRWSQRA